MKVYDINHANYVQPVGKVPTNNSTLALTNASMLIKTEPLEGENICMDLAAVGPYILIIPQPCSSHLSCCLFVFSSLAWALICCTSMVSGLRLRM